MRSLWIKNEPRPLTKDPHPTCTHLATTKSKEEAEEDIQQQVSLITISVKLPEGKEGSESPKDKSLLTISMLTKAEVEGEILTGAEIRLSSTIELSLITITTSMTMMRRKNRWKAAQVRILHVKIRVYNVKILPQK